MPAAGPSPVTAPPPGTAAAPAPGTAAQPPAFPADVDPSYVRTIVYIDPAGYPKRWEGGPFHHCFDAGVEAHRAVVEAVANRMTAITGIPRTEAGPCNITWRIAPDPYVDVPAGSANANLGNDVAIYRAVVTFRFEDFVTPTTPGTCSACCTPGGRSI